MSPSTSLGISYPASSDHVRLWEHMQDMAEDVNGLMVHGTGMAVASGAVNTITATSFSALPNNLTMAITNGNTTRAWLGLVSYGAWMLASASGVRATITASGGLTIGSAIGSGGPWGYGEMLYCSSAAATQHFGFFSVAIPAGASVTFQMQAMRDAGSGTQEVRYPTLRWTPLHFV